MTWTNDTKSLFFGNIDNGPDVIPMQFLGSAETELTVATTMGLLMYALCNLSGEGGYAVCHGSQFVNTFPIQTGDSKESQFSTHAFPTLFPYREGGIEIKQSQNVAFKEHIQWCLQYHDC